MWQNFLKSFNKSFLQIDTDRCLRTRDEDSLCSNCEDICPQPALKIVDRKLQFDQTTCSSCRLCVHVCPTEAIQADAEKLQRYEEKIRSSDTVYFACKEYGSNAPDVVLPCVLSLTPEMLMISSLYNKKVYILWDEKMCLSCHTNWTHKRCLDWINDWNDNRLSEEEVKIITNKKINIGIKTKLPKTERIFISNKETKNMPSKIQSDDGWREDYEKKGKLPLTIRRRYLLAYIKEIKKEVSLPRSISEKVGLVNIRVTDNCQLCSKCSQMCPTGALQMREEDNTKTLVFDPSYCIDCDICEHSCLEINKEPISIEEVDHEIILKELN